MGMMSINSVNVHGGNSGMTLNAYMPMAWLFHTSPSSNTPFWFTSTQMSYSPGVSGCDQTRVTGRSPVLLVEAFAVADGKAYAPSEII